jgi:hypothetical protein
LITIICTYFCRADTDLSSELDQIEACYSRLKQLVPTVPLDVPLSSVQLLQHVIDYIADLELTLDATTVAQFAVVNDALSRNCSNNSIGDTAFSSTSSCTRSPVDRTELAQFDCDIIADSSQSH